MAAERSVGGAPQAAPEPAIDKVLPRDLVDAMLDWYAEMGRDLPWRRTRDPYAILVSEIMLQQTRVETILGRYESFLERFPTLSALAAAPLDDVLAEWSGLGYYRRPRGLHALANAVVDEHGGELPRSLEALRALPGIGPYTAAAVGSIAFGIPALSVDGNVGRIMCRIAGIEDDPRRAPVRRQLESMVAPAMRTNAPGQLNQAIMELGARVCTPRSPHCEECPCAAYCEAHALGIEELIPPTSRQAVEAVTEYAAVIEHAGRYLLFRGQRPSLIPDMWEFPTLDSRLVGREAAGGSASPANRKAPATKIRLESHLANLGWPVSLGPKLGEIRHAMTSRRIVCRVFEGTIRTPAPGSNQLEKETTPKPAEDAVREPENENLLQPEAGWFTPDEVQRLPLAASARKTLVDLLDIDLTAPESPHYSS